MTTPICLYPGFTPPLLWQEVPPTHREIEKMWYCDALKCLVSASDGHVTFTCHHPELQGAIAEQLVHCQRLFGGGPTERWAWREGNVIPTGATAYHLEEVPEPTLPFGVGA